MPHINKNFIEEISYIIENAASLDNICGKILRFFGIDLLNNVLLKS